MCWLIILCICTVFFHVYCMCVIVTWNLHIKSYWSWRLQIWSFNNRINLCTRHCCLLISRKSVHKTDGRIQNFSWRDEGVPRDNCLTMGGQRHKFSNLYWSEFDKKFKITRKRSCPSWPFLIFGDKCYLVYCIVYANSRVVSCQSHDKNSVNQFTYRCM